MSFKLTDSQYRAVYDSKKNILVSAGAGSGKTAVLVSRIIRLIKEEDASFDNMLIVTFTNASAKWYEKRLKKDYQKR